QQRATRTPAAASGSGPAGRSNHTQRGADADSIAATTAHGSAVDTASTSPLAARPSPTPVHTASPTSVPGPPTRSATHSTGSVGCSEVPIARERGYQRSHGTLRGVLFVDLAVTSRTVAATSKRSEKVAALA